MIIRNYLNHAGIRKNAILNIIYNIPSIYYRGNNTGDTGPQGPQGQKGEKGDSPPQPSPPTGKCLISYQIKKYNLFCKHFFIISECEIWLVFD